MYDPTNRVEPLPKRDSTSAASPSVVASTRASFATTSTVLAYSAPRRVCSPRPRVSTPLVSVNVSREAPLVIPGQASVGYRVTALLHKTPQAGRGSLGQHDRIRHEDQRVSREITAFELGAVNEVHRNVVLGKHAVVADQGVAVRLGIILAPLGAADELRERVVHDGHVRRHGTSCEE